MPADMNDYFKKRKPNTQPPKSDNGGNNGGFENPFGGANNFGGGKGFSALVIILAIIFGIFLLKPFTIINSGEVGIKVTTGKFQKEPLNPGLHFYIPIFEKIIPVNVRVRMITYPCRPYRPYRPFLQEAYPQVQNLFLQVCQQP
jgi:hypothetical protein